MPLSTSRWTLGLFLAVVAIWTCPRSSFAESKPDADETRLREAKVGVDDKALLSFVRERAGDDKDLLDLDKLLRQLGSEQFEERDGAAKKLAGLGLAAYDGLRTALRDKDQEVRARAKEILDQLEKTAQPEAVMSAARVLARRRPQGAAEVLLRYLPFAGETEVAEEVWFTLDAITSKQRDLDPVFVKTLADAMPVRRAAAAYVLGRRGDKDQKAASRKLLADKDALVRLRAVQGLLGAGDKEAIPALVKLLDEPSLMLAWQAEELLRFAAGEKAPDAVLGNGAAPAREKCRQAWADWWSEAGAKLDLDTALKGHRRPGLMLVHESERFKDEEHRLCIYGCDRTTRWRMEGLKMVSDARLMASGKVLIAEWPRGYRSEGKTPCISERDLDGKVLWSYQEMPAPASCRRLWNGNTFMTSLYEVRELNANGELVYSSNVQNFRIGRPRDLGALMYPVRLRNGHPLYQDYDGAKNRLTLAELDDTTWRVLRRIDVLDKLELTNGLANPQELPNGHFLLAGARDQVIREIDSDGATVWRLKPYRYPFNVVRLRGGDTLLVTGDLALADANGRIVWEGLTNGVTRNAWPCFDSLRLGFDAPRTLDLADDAMAIAYRIKELEDKDPFIQKRSLGALADFGPQAEVIVPRLLEACADVDEKECKVLANIMFKVSGADSLPLFLKAAKDTHTYVRTAGICLLRKYHDKSDEVLSLVLEGIEDKEVVIRRMAANSLQTFKADAKKVVPALIKALKDPDAGSVAQPSVSFLSVSSLEALGPEAKDAVSTLADVVKDENAAVIFRCRAARALGSIGPDALSAVEVLKGAQKDKNNALREEAENALTKIRR